MGSEVKLYPVSLPSTNTHRSARGLLRALVSPPQAQCPTYLSPFVKSPLVPPARWEHSVVIKGPPLRPTASAALNIQFSWVLTQHSVFTPCSYITRTQHILFACLDYFLWANKWFFIKTFAHQIHFEEDEYFRNICPSFMSCSCLRYVVTEQWLRKVTYWKCLSVFWWLPPHEKISFQKINRERFYLFPKPKI